MVQYVGIVNITPDSFSDGGQFFGTENAIKHAHQLVSEGASVVDLGAQSTRPNAELLTVDQEWQRLQPVLEGLRGIKATISIDTFYPEIIVRALEYFPDLIINDITTAHDPKMRQLVASSGNRIFLSHLPFAAGGDVQAAHRLEPLVDSAEVVKDELLQRRQELIDLGARPEQIILDPGIGFGKTMRLSTELIDFASQVPGIPVLIGHSRKRFIAQNLGLDRYDAAVNARLAEQAIDSGAHYLRVHDIPKQN